LSKKRALAAIVSCASVLSRVRDTKLEPGSLKAICPSGPIPPINNSIPPASFIFSSYCSHSFCKSPAFPSLLLLELIFLKFILDLFPLYI
jgi:hypothetical protein